MSKIETGRKAPSFTLPGTTGAWSLKGAAGQNVVLYFYPRDNTSGCTREGQDFAAAHARFRAARTLILGVSPDSVESHVKWQAKMGFPFELLSDADRKVCTLYDVIREKSMYGRKFLGVERSTFLIDKEGVLREIWRKVKVNGHAEEVLAAVREL